MSKTELVRKMVFITIQNTIEIKLGIIVHNYI